METYANVGNIPAASNKHGNMMAACRFFPKQNKIIRREGAKKPGGYRGVGVHWLGDKKTLILGRIIFLLSIFSVHQVLSTIQTLHVGLKERFCERVGGLVLVTIVFNSFNFYSIDR